MRGDRIARWAAFAVFSTTIFGALGSVALADAPAPAAANVPSSKPISLTWKAPEGCPNEAATEERIAKLLGGFPTSSDHHLAAFGTVESTPSGFRLELTLSSDTSESKRILEGSTCDALTDAGALVIALAFDPEAVAAQGAAGREPTPVAPTVAPTVAPVAPIPPTVAPVAPTLVRIPISISSSRTPAESTRSKVTWGAEAAFQADLGTLPGVSPGFRAGPFLEFHGFRFSPTFEALPSSRATLKGRPRAGAEFRLLMFSFSVCKRLIPMVNVAGCLGFDAGEMAATGFGVSSTTTQGVLWVAPTAEALGELRVVRHLSLTVNLGISIPIDRKRFVLDLKDGRTPIFEPSVVSGRAGAGLLLRL